MSNIRPGQMTEREFMESRLRATAKARALLMATKSDMDLLMYMWENQWLRDRVEFLESEAQRYA
jgi:hypothetical protein